MPFHSQLQRSAHRLPRDQRGLSLIELLISITLGLIILAALVTVFSQNSRSYRQNDASAQMQDNARFALEALTRDLMMAGHFGGMFSGNDITSVPSAPGNDCGAVDSANRPWAYATGTRLEFTGNTTPSSILSKYSCLGSNPVVAGTDVVVIRRANSQSAFDAAAGVTSATVSPQTAFLQTNGTVGSLSLSSSAGQLSLSPTPTSVFQWLPRLYFIRSFSHVAGDGIPALCRMELLGTPPAMTVECLADGIDDLQIEWGLDLDGDAIPDTYTSNPGTSLDQAVTARIWLLAQTTQPEAGYKDGTTYTLADNTTAPQASFPFHRRVYSTTVQLRNPVH